MDVIIITMSQASQADYWQKYFDRQNQFEEHFIFIHEDWPGGAGNGLGSLYAFCKANQAAEKKLGIDLFDFLTRNRSIGLFHCAGMERRLYPLAYSENNSQFAIQLPSPEGLKSMMEYLIHHTIPLFKHIKNRFFVFWGDQLFLPSRQFRQPKSHVEILSQSLPLPSESEWTQRELEKYGVLILSENGGKRLIEKVSYSELIQFIAAGSYNESSQIGLSLGSFSLSPPLLKLLLEAFDEELQLKRGQLNSCSHFWMPMMWEKSSYLRFMKDKGFNSRLSEEVYNKMQGVKETLGKAGKTALFGNQEIGEDAYWWDFDGLKDYFYHLLSLVNNRPKGLIFREMLGIERFYDRERNSILINCDVERLDVKNSVLVNVISEKLFARDSVIINSRCKELTCSHALAYNVIETRAKIYLSRGEALANGRSTEIDRTGKEEEVKLVHGTVLFSQSLT